MEQSCEAEFEAAYQAIDVAIDDIGEALQIFGERFLGALYAPEVQAMRHLAIASSGKTELGRLIYERGAAQPGPGGGGPVGGDGPGQAAVPTPPS
jgi:hypothetical protein